MKYERKVQMTANVIEILNPSTTLAKTSLPVLSVPSKCLPEKPSGFVGGLFSFHFLSPFSSINGSPKSYFLLLFLSSYISSS